MNRRFKHKKTYKIATEVTDTFPKTLSYYIPEHGFISSEFIEDSNDWEEITCISHDVICHNCKSDNWTAMFQYHSCNECGAIWKQTGH